MRVILNFSHIIGATRGAGIFVDNQHFSNIWASNVGSVGQVFDWQGYLSGSSLKLSAIMQPIDFELTSAELYF